MTGQESATSRPVADGAGSAQGQDYTEQDVRWLAEQIETVEVAVQYDGYPSARSCSKQEIAEQALAALAAAGRLLPEDPRRPRISRMHQEYGRRRR